jgi:filamentous hemagglutinin
MNPRLVIKVLTSTIQTRISKDAELLNLEQVDSVTWHFFNSPVTGQGGPSAPLLKALQDAGFGVVTH